MPQLSLYFDEDTLKKIEIAAKMNNISLSKYVSDTLKDHFSNNWPVGFSSVFGSISDETFVKHEFTDYSADTERETL